MRNWTTALLMCLSCCPNGTTIFAQTVDPPLDAEESRFVNELYPQFRSVQCHLCHNDNGVASAYGIEFPGGNASQAQILAFGYQLAEFIRSDQPDQSTLLRKPTGRDEHTGGVRVQPGTIEEARLKEWIEHLAQLTPEQQVRARHLIRQAQTWKREPLSLQRLTHSQYNHTVRDLLHDQSQPANQFPKEDFIRGFRNQLEGQGISPLLAEAYSQAAERLARSAFRGGDPHGLLPTRPQSANDVAAAEAFVKQFGLRAFRRPLNTAEVAKYSTLLRTGSGQLPTASADDAFRQGASLVVEAMLQSPHFLYRRVAPSSENSTNQPDATAETGLDPYATAARLSYLLWDTMPDEQLFSAAQRGELRTTEQIESHVRRMLADTRAKQALHEFLSQWLRFDRVLSATRDRRRFRQFNSEVAGAMVEETERLFDHLVDSDLNFMELYTADYTFINAPLAELYGLPQPPSDFQKVAYPGDSGRSGILGHGTFLVSTSKPAETSPTARGLFIRNQLLSQEIAPPPPGVNSTLPEIAEDKPMTNRARLELHLNSEACASCHRLIDPIGYAFEQYDAIGGFNAKLQLRFGTRDNPIIKELDVDTAAYVQGMVDSQFSQPRELGKLLAESETAQRSIVKHYFRYAMGREETAADQPIIDSVYRTFRDSGFRFREMVVAMIKETSN